jgi:uncharacterized protein
MQLSGSKIRVEVIYAEPQRTVAQAFELTAPACIRDVLQLAASASDFAGIDVQNASVGIFGKLAASDQVLADRDRIEIYRPLAIDPKNARRERARQARRKT